MSKTVKEMIVREYEARFEGVEDAALVSVRGISNESTGKIRAGLREKDIQITVVRNALAKKAFAETPLDGLCSLLEGPNAVAYGAESVVEVARELVDVVKQFPELELKGAILDGQLFEGDEGVKALSKFPTRDEAIANVVTLIISPHKKLIGAIASPGSKLVSVVKEVSERLEKGETIAAVN